MTMKYGRKKISFLVANFVLFSVFACAVTPQLPIKASSEKEAKEKLDAYVKFTQILNIIENEYVDEVNASALVDKALKGLLNNLDAHSSYMDKKAFQDLNVQTSGEFGGLGISVGMRDNALTVIAPIQDTPADKAGVKAGDIILKLDEKATMGMNIDEAVSIMRGKPKTSITLTILRKDEPKPLEIKIVRDIIKVQSVFTKHIDDDILHIHVSSFDKKVVSGVKEALQKNPKAKGLILDLRNNPGGLLNQAVGLVDLFVDKGVIVSQKGKVATENIQYKAKSNSINSTIPIVVIVNGGSASASEIVSGALQDLNRGVVVGEKTFGKGSVQAVLPVGNEEALRLTVARYYLPNGRSIQAEGVTPDITIYPGVVTQEENGLVFKESDLAKHLENDKPKKQIKKETKQTDKIAKEDLYQDAQLKSAVDILRALILTQERKR